MNVCPKCDAQINWATDRCLVCNQDLGVPNQRLVNREHEVIALNQRYQTALKATQQRGANQELAAFEHSVASQSQAVMNSTAQFLFGFLSSENQLYANYRQQTTSATRKIAELDNDRHRCGTEGILFGSMADKLSYAALTLDNKGLVSYGKCAIMLKDITMKLKATILEENSYDFVKRHRIVPGDELPVGYWANWQNRHLLAVAKLAEQIQPNTQDFASLLLYSNGDRHQDKFIEVHIYGSFDSQAIDKLTLPRKKAKEPMENTLLCSIKDYAQKLNIPWSDYD